MCNEGEETHENGEESDQVPVANNSSSKRKGNRTQSLQYAGAHKISLQRLQQI